MSDLVVGSSKPKTYDKWEAENDLRTLQDAKRIQADKTRMANVRRAAKEKLAEMDGLKKLANGSNP